MSRSVRAVIIFNYGLSANCEIIRQIGGEIMVHEVETHRRTLIEQQLVAIWCEILDIPTLGPREDIYEAGATSLDVARVAARIKKQFGRELRLKVLVEAPTVEQIAEILDSDPALDMPLVV